MGRYYLKNGFKICPKCLENKEAAAFGFRSSGKINSWCISCKRENSKKWSLKRTPEYDRNANLKAKFNITLDDFKSMLDAQGGVCAICKQTNGDKPLCVDHCHATGSVRKLLCNKCNTGLGMFRDNPEYLAEAIKYLGG